MVQPSGFFIQASAFLLLEFVSRVQNFVFRVQGSHFKGTGFTVLGSVNTEHNFHQEVGRAGDTERQDAG